jgi:hypothetical protein
VRLLRSKKKSPPRRRRQRKQRTRLPSLPLRLPLLKHRLLSLRFLPHQLLL